ncbi:MAG: methylmalonyl Co-A mutase-associated GTPase MeaB [Flavobacteriaceae bacterium]
MKKPSNIQKITLKRGKQPSVNEYITNICDGDIPFLSKAITLIESTNPKHKDIATRIIKGCLPFANKSVRIGITGVPGVGKSTFIEALGHHILQASKKIAVLAIDPSSSINKGSILGDKTRMESLVRNKNVFIRPSPSGNNLGGVARKTRETIILCEAAGFDTILIETVGVGQSETMVHSMVDFFLLLKIAGTGDELQGIKRGIIEMADAIVINKIDNSSKANVQRALSDFKNALHLYPIKESTWQPKVTSCSALNNQNIDAIWNIIQDYLVLTKKNAYFQTRRNLQNEYWLLETLNQNVLNHFYSDSKIKLELKNALNTIKNQKGSPFEMADILLNSYFKLK